MIEAMDEKTQPKRGRGRPRREGADAEIIAVALELLRARGYGALTVDEVAERAGVAKTTIYRRWPSKGALVAAVIAPLAIPAAPDTGSLEGDVVALLEDFCTMLSGELGPVACGLVGEAQRDPELIPVIEKLTATRRQRFGDAIDRGITRGELAPTTDRELLVDAFLGAVWYRLLLRRRSIDATLPRALATLVLDGALAR